MKSGLSQKYGFGGLDTFKTDFKTIRLSTYMQKLATETLLKQADMIPKELTDG
ncbi:MAG: hypothetical protein ACOCYO_03610 [Bacteroidota bacterium]